MREPASAVEEDDDRMRAAPLGQAQPAELQGAVPVGNPVVGRWRLHAHDVVRAQQVLREDTGRRYSADGHQHHAPCGEVAKGPFDGGVAGAELVRHGGLSWTAGCQPAREVLNPMSVPSSLSPRIHI